MPLTRVSRRLSAALSATPFGVAAIHTSLAAALTTTHAAAIATALPAATHRHPHRRHHPHCRRRCRRCCCCCTAAAAAAAALPPLLLLLLPLWLPQLLMLLMLPPPLMLLPPLLLYRTVASEAGSAATGRAARALVAVAMLTKPNSKQVYTDPGAQSSPQGVSAWHLRSQGRLTGEVRWPGGPRYARTAPRPDAHEQDRLWRGHTQLTSRPAAVDCCARKGGHRTAVGR